MRVIFTHSLSVSLLFTASCYGSSLRSGGRCSYFLLPPVAGLVLEEVADEVVVSFATSFVLEEAADVSVVAGLVLEEAADEVAVSSVVVGLVLEEAAGAVETSWGWVKGRLRGSASLLSEGMSSRVSSANFRRFMDPCSSWGLFLTV